ncbi:DUF3306 domain-containing protein [Limibaculum sp. FT325]|uniref:DUF3306 domain-containing protein n=1 Tax=Thermohalobaculum sediminis TaxID=2939436 RepID=UPI0020C070BC|nr:DUF3306 domain-containing protein [Limibaculum sediminis]MCL5775637.1 DUF3306 domain-containing protein [Limibaculum sediminis]
MSARDPSLDADFLGRWSRLKRARATETEPPQDPAPTAPAEASVQGGTPEPEPKTDEEVLAELGLPHPETLGPGDDFAAFMAKAVPEHLRRIALRRLWISNPVLACLDDLVDYADDYTDAALAVEKLETGYRVGCGFLTDDDLAPPGAGRADGTAMPGAEPEQADDPEGGAGAADEVAATAPEPDAQAAAHEGAAEPEITVPEPDEGAAPAVAETLETPLAARRPRMRFRLADS